MQDEYFFKMAIPAIISFYRLLIWVNYLGKSTRPVVSNLIGKTSTIALSTKILRLYFQQGDSIFIAAAVYQKQIRNSPKIVHYFPSVGFEPLKLYLNAESLVCKIQLTLRQSYFVACSQRRQIQLGILSNYSKFYIQRLGVLQQYPDTQYTENHSIMPNPLIKCYVTLLMNRTQIQAEPICLQKVHQISF